MNTDKKTVTGEGKALRVQLEKSIAADSQATAPIVKHYRGWMIKARPGNVAFTIHREGWQQRHNFKSVENAEAGIDAIVG